MKVTRQSMASGKTRTKDLPITPVQYVKYIRGEGHVQDIMPDLPPEDREFLISGVTQEEWEELYGKNEDDE
jgi:hypothetical protein|tara:strand:- start:282 stop:494 length:213 start_codon:yes stop_codon:yes gene_type:complete